MLGVGHGPSSPVILNGQIDETPAYALLGSWGDRVVPQIHIEQCPGEQG